MYALLAACLQLPVPAPLLAAPPGRLVQAAPALEPVFLELAAERTELFVGELFSVRAVFGFEPGFREEHLVPLFRQALELPVQLELPFAEGLDCAVALRASGGMDGPRLVLGERVVAAAPLGTVERDGRPFEAHAVELRFRAACPGPLALAGASLRYAQASGFRQDLFEGRVPLDARERDAVAAPLALTLLPLPEEGRPRDFGGAVGDFSVSAVAEPLELALGETLRVTLEVRGSGDLDGFERPRPEWPGFTFLGATEERLADARRIRFDLRPESASVERVPGIELPYFRPGPRPAYALAASAPIPIRVRPLAVPAVPREPALDAPAAEPGTSWMLGLTLAAALLAVAALARALRGRSRRPAPSPEARALDAQLTAGEDPASAWTDYLAGRLDCPAAAVVGAPVAERLVAAGHAPHAAERAARLLELLVAARYGGPVPADAAARARRAARELESSRA